LTRYAVNDFTLHDGIPRAHRGRLARGALIALLGWIHLTSAQAADKPEVFTQLGHSEEIATIMFSPDGRTLVSGSGGETILWDTVSGRELRRLVGGRVSPHGTTLATETENETIELRDIQSGHLLHTLDGHPTGFIIFSEDDQTLAAVIGDTIKLWDVASGRELHALRGDKDTVDVVDFAPDGRTLVSW
jgi:WD40 repeat protein